MKTTKKVILGIILLLLGSIGFIISCFNMEYNTGFIGVLIVSVVAAIQGVIMIDCNVSR